MLQLKKMLRRYIDKKMFKEQGTLLVPVPVFYLMVFICSFAFLLYVSLIKIYIQIELLRFMYIFF